MKVHPERRRACANESVESFELEKVETTNCNDEHSKFNLVVLENR